MAEHLQGRKRVQKTIHIDPDLLLLIERYGFSSLNAVIEEALFCFITSYKKRTPAVIGKSSRR